MDTVIRLKNITKSFGEQTVLDGLDLDIERGVITFVLGKSGTGKSVLLKHIMGLLKPDSGTIEIDGQDITNFDEFQMNEVRTKFGLLFQDAALFDSMNAYENVAFPIAEHTDKNTSEIKEIVAKKLDQVALSGVDNKYPSELSGGMRKRVGLARAIALDPEIILYDEPTTGLDPLMVEQVNELIVSTQKAQNATTIVISHDIPAALRIADRIAVLYEGKVVAEGTPDDIKQSKHMFVVDFLKAAG